MTRSLLEPRALPGFALLPSGPEDRYFDYCLEPYRPRRSWQGKLRSENFLWASLDVAGARQQLGPPLLAVQRSLGPDLTVWGVKWDGQRLFWEAYVYDPRKEDPKATLEGLTKTLASHFEILPRVPESTPYTMVSFDLDEAAARRGSIEEVNLYLTAERGHAGRSYVCRRDGTELANTYRFLDPKRDVDEVLALIKSSAFVDYADRAVLGKVMPPELFACRRICVAKKRGCDALYFSGISIEQLETFLARFGYPQPIRDFAAQHRERFAHLSFDVGLDYLQEPGSRSLVHPKTSFYGTL